MTIEHNYINRQKQAERLISGLRATFLFDDNIVLNAIESQMIGDTTTSSEYEVLEVAAEILSKPTNNEAFWLMNLLGAM